MISYFKVCLHFKGINAQDTFQIFKFTKNNNLNL